MFRSTLNDVKGRRYNHIGVVKTVIYASNYDGDMSDMMNDALDNLDSQAEEWDADGVIGITFASLSTYYTDDDDNTYPDIMAFGTAIEFLDEDD